MKIIAIDEWLPWPLENGKKIRTNNLMRRLARRHEIFYIAFGKPLNDEENIRALERQGIRVIIVEDTRTKKWTFKFYLQVISNMFSDEPFSSKYHIKNNFIKVLLKTVEIEKPDLVHCEWTNLAPFLKFISGLPIVISAHNIESNIWKRLAENSASQLVKLVANQQARKIESLEREWYAKADLCIAVSELDKNVIEGYGGKACVVENGVDIEYYDLEMGSEEKNQLSYVASFDTFANQDAAIFFVKEIFPLIKKKHPDVRFYLIGKDPPRKVRCLQDEDPHVYVTGTVPDVREYIMRSKICVVPLRIGGGSRLKILEAMALKKPIVSTTIGAEGLKIKNGENIVVADKPEEFADCVCDLLRNPSKCKNLGNGGWQLVKSNYNWEALVEKQDDAWKSLKR